MEAPLAEGFGLTRCCQEAHLRMETIMSYGVFGLTSFTIGVMVVITAGVWALTIILAVKDCGRVAAATGLITFVLTVLLIVTMFTTSGIWVAGGVFVAIGGAVALVISALPVIAVLEDS